MDIIKALQREHKTAHFMLVDGMSKLTTHQVLSCQSSVFHVFGLKWKLIIYPAGKDGLKDYLSFYLRIKDREPLGSNWKVQCNLKLSVVSQTRPNKSESFELPGVCYDEYQALNGKECFMSHWLLNLHRKGYLVNDKVIFSAEITNVKTDINVTVPRRTMGTAERLKVMEVARNNCRFTWKITQFSSFNGKNHSSDEFTVGPRRWSLAMYPNGYDDGEGNSLSLYLHARDYVTNGPQAKTLAVFKLRVLDQLHRKHAEFKIGRWFSPGSAQNNSGWGETQVLPLEKLKDSSWGFLVKDEIYIGVEFLILSTTEYL